MQGAGGESCPGGGEDSQSGAQRRSGLERKMEQSPALGTIGSQRVHEWAQWEKKDALMFKLCVITFGGSSWLCSDRLPDALVQQFLGSSLTCSKRHSGHLADKGGAAGTPDIRIFWKKDLMIAIGHKELRGRQRTLLSIGKLSSPHWRRHIF